MCHPNTVFTSSGSNSLTKNYYPRSFYEVFHIKKLSYDLLLVYTEDEVLFYDGHGKFHEVIHSLLSNLIFDSHEDECFVCYVLTYLLTEGCFDTIDLSFLLSSYDNYFVTIN